MTVLPIRGCGGIALQCRVCVHWSAPFLCTGLQVFCRRSETCNFCSIDRIDSVVAPSAAGLTLDDPSGTESPQDVVHLPFFHPSFLRDRRDGRPASPLVIRPIRQREQDKQFATLVWGVVPDGCHNADAHPFPLFLPALAPGALEPARWVATAIAGRVRTFSAWRIALSREAMSAMIAFSLFEM